MLMFSLPAANWWRLGRAGSAIGLRDLLPLRPAPQRDGQAPRPAGAAAGCRLADAPAGSPGHSTAILRETLIQESTPCREQLRPWRSSWPLSPSPPPRSRATPPSSPCSSCWKATRSGASAPITAIDNLAVNGQGDWLIEADTNNADTNIDSVILGRVGLGAQEGQALVLPAGSSLDSFDALTLNDAGNTGWNLFLAGTAGTNDDTGIYRNGDLVLQEGTLSGAAGFSAGTPYIGFFETRYNDNEQILVIASVDDPAIASTVDRALVVFQVDGTGALLSETIVAKEGDVLPGQGFAAADFGTGPHNFAFNDAGDVMFFVDTVDPVTAADGAIYLNSPCWRRRPGLRRSPRVPGSRSRRASWT